MANFLPFLDILHIRIFSSRDFKTGIHFLDEVSVCVRVAQHQINFIDYVLPALYANRPLPEAMRSRFVE